MWGQQNQSMYNVTSLQWVIGEAGASSAYVTPGTSALLMDSQNPVFWIKTVDYTGRPIQMRKFRFEEIVQGAQQQEQRQTDAMADMDRRISAIEAMLAKPVKEADNG